MGSEGSARDQEEEGTARRRGIGRDWLRYILFNHAEQSLLEYEINFAMTDAIRLGWLVSSRVTPRSSPSSRPRTW